MPLAAGPGGQGGDGRVLDDAAGADDGHAVAQQFNLAEGVAGEQDRPPSAAADRSSAYSTCWISGSSPVVGSSRIKSGGRCMSAWISPSFWRIPRE